MRIVLDTNVLLVSFSSRSQFYPLFESFLNEEFVLCVSTDIMLEYEEILSKHVGTELANLVLQLIENAPNTEFKTRFYEWGLIKADPDDNKFVDCAIASQAKFIVTQDKHFNILRNIEFPKMEIIEIQNFIEEELGKKLNDQ